MVLITRNYTKVSVIIIYVHDYNVIYTERHLQNNYNLQKCNKPTKVEHTNYTDTVS